MSGQVNLAKPGQFLKFSLDQEVFALPVGDVIEITQVPEIRDVPNAPDYVEGIFSLRKQVVPVVNLRKKFKKPPIEKQKMNTVIVINSPQGLIGIMVDSVSEVIELKAADISHAPALMNSMTHQFVTGIGKFQNTLIVLVDILADIAEKLVVETEEAKADDSETLAKPKAA